MSNGFGDSEQRACAKLTLHLHMTGRRADGYHLLESEMVSLDFADELTFENGSGLKVTGPAASSVPSGTDNLVNKALGLARRPAQVSLHKHIPPGAGLGGGSSDAAAALRWAQVSDLRVAARVGSDVPFCVAGGRALVTGVGDELQPLPFVARVFTLLIPPFGVNTTAVYRAFDEGVAPVPKKAANHLQAAAMIVEPRLVEWRDKLADATGTEPVLAGSGATWFVEGECPKPPDDVIAGGTWVVARTTEPIPLN